MATSAKKEAEVAADANLVQDAPAGTTFKSSGEEIFKDHKRHWTRHPTRSPNHQIKGTSQVSRAYQGPWVTPTPARRPDAPLM